MSLFADYIKERENKSIIECEKGFATYSIYSNGECYLQDIYVAPEYRKQHIGSQMADEVVKIAQEQKCHTLVGSVCIDALGCTESMKAFLSYGMKLSTIRGNIIFLKKDI